jgi:hypothetical protein
MKRNSPRNKKSGNDLTLVKQSQPSLGLNSMTGSADVFCSSDALIMPKVVVIGDIPQPQHS